MDTKYFLHGLDRLVHKDTNQHGLYEEMKGLSDINLKDTIYKIGIIIAPMAYIT
jgi:hypothetical protein